MTELERLLTKQLKAQSEAHKAHLTRLNDTQEKLSDALKVQAASIELLSQRTEKLTQRVDQLMILFQERE